MSEQAAGSVSSSEADSLASSVDLFVPLSLSHALAKRRRVCISAGTEYLHQHVCVCPGTLEHECLSCTSMCVCPRTCEHECMSGRFLVSCFARPRSAGSSSSCRTTPSMPWTACVWAPTSPRRGRVQSCWRPSCQRAGGGPRSGVCQGRVTPSPSVPARLSVPGDRSASPTCANV